MNNFIYDVPVSGKNFIGRKNETTILQNLLSQGENVEIHTTPKGGKTSLLNQVFFKMRISGIKFTAVNVPLLNIRTIADLTIRMGGEILKAYYRTPSEFSEAVRKYLNGTHFVFDPAVFSGRGQVLSLNWDIDDNDIKAIFTLPYSIVAERSDERIILCLKEFQNVMFTEDGDRICKILSDIFKDTADGERRCSFVFTGSCVNAMKDIFEIRKLFYRTVERLNVEPIETRDLIDYIMKGFMTGGKVVEHNLLESICALFRNDVWYISHFASICDQLSKGYIMEPVLNEALGQIISIHEPKFEAMMNSLTTFQVCLLRAIIDGHTKFSSNEVILRYNLNSSANVRRVKDALCKKEIVTFGENDEPMILDPLFEYWVKKYFFEINVE